MQREPSPPRPDWERRCEALGFDFHHLGGEPYWVEDFRYRFTSEQVDELDDATAELHKLCLQAVEHVVANRLYERLSIPPEFGFYIETTWKRRDPTICGRFDLAYDGRNPPKMLEYNADTPTSLFEAAVVQWQWLKEVLPDADQFNSAHEKLVEAWRAVAERLAPGAVVHFARSEEDPEDLLTSEYLRDTCQQAGLTTEILKLADIGWNGARFTDLAERPIQVLHKLYPWEWMVREEFAAHVLSDRTAFVEPAWKMVLSNKALLPLLWEGFPGHANLLPAFHEPHADLGERYVRKPVFGREGSNVSLVGPGLGREVGGPYGAEGFVHQAYAPLPVFDGMHAVIGSWIVGGETAGVGVREDPTPITHNRSRFVPHYF
jgi:glutathionylspermidine synthase